MKKEELIKKLKELPDNAPVYLMTGEEGCLLIKDIFYSDSLGNDEDNQNWEGIIVSSEEAGSNE